MPIRTYREALDFWQARINYEHRGMPADLAELKLDRMSALLERLGNPHERLRIVHIAGSKGKGSTAAMLASVLRCAGRRTGLFTSPHLSRVEERCQVDGEPISEVELTEQMGRLEPHVLALESVGMTPTFFEIVTALGFLHFVRCKVELGVVEVGLGGRFDATNVCRPLVSIITSISHDHTQQLGDTLAAIAREKAGIIKPGRPVISGVSGAEAVGVIEEVARRYRAPLLQLGRDFDYRHQPGRVSAAEWIPPLVSVAGADFDFENVELSLLGEHQAANASLAAVCVRQLESQGLAIGEAALRAGLRQVHWPGRMEVVCRRPMTILDCAHNGASMQALVRTLQTSFPPARRRLVFACSRDKDQGAMMAVLAPHFEHAYLTRYTTSSRSAVPDDLADHWRRNGGGSCAAFADPLAAWQAARAAAAPDDLICVTGSVFLVGELRPVLMGKDTTIAQAAAVSANAR